MGQVKTINANITIRTDNNEFKTFCFIFKLGNVAGSIKLIATSGKLVNLLARDAPAIKDNKINIKGERFFWKNEKTKSQTDTNKNDKVSGTIVIPKCGKLLKVNNASQANVINNIDLVLL